MSKIEGTGRKLFVEWPIVNKTENKFQVTYKFFNYTISAKAHIQIMMMKLKMK